MKILEIEVDKIILVLISVGLLILLFFPASLSANHFRYGTMSWDLIDNDTISLKMENGWTSNHNGWNSYNVGDIQSNYFTITWGDGTDTGALVDLKILSRDNDSLNTLTSMGDSSSGWEAGLTHDYDNGTHVIYWGSSARETVKNNNGNTWRNEAMVRIGGDYIGNVSPVSAVPPRVNVQDNRSFTYQVSATDANGDDLTYRWGTKAEFFGSSGSFLMPTGMTLSSTGLIEWDIRDSITCSGCSNNVVVDNDSNKLWGAVIMVEDRLDNGTAKSYIPIDFFFNVTSADNDAPNIIGLPTTTQTVSVGSTKTYVFTTTDDSGVAPTVSILNPPTDNSTIWSTESATSGGTTTFTITFAPDVAMGGSSYVVNIRSTDAASMTKDQSLSLQISTVANADPTAPALKSPADVSNISQPVTFKFAKSTDADGDNVSYTMYVCIRSDFSGCSGTSVIAVANFIHPFNQNLYDNLMPWASQLHASTISQQIFQGNSVRPTWFFMLIMLGLLCGLISLYVKNITFRRIIFMMFLVIIGTTMSCSSDDSDSIQESASTEAVAITDTTDDTSSDDASIVTVTNSGYTSGSNYYWKVVASDPKGGSADSDTWSFTVQ